MSTGAEVRTLICEVLHEGIVAPLLTLSWGVGANPGTFDGGVYYADGAVCERSLHKKMGFVNVPQPLAQSRDLPRVCGTHLYGGMLKNEHFGHFLLESLARLWALGHSPVGFESIVFYARMHGQPVPSWATDLIALVAPGISIRMVSEPTTFDTLIVPDQVAHPSNGCVYGHPLIRQAFATLQQIKGKSHKKLYVSRSGLLNAGSFLGERVLEQAMVSEGYSVFHPQDHSVEDQLSYYNGAERLIFAEGSAIHFFALTGRSDQRVYIVQRRKNPSLFVWQLRTFGLSPVVGPGPPTEYFLPERSAKNTLLARSKIDFEELRRQLFAEGFSANDAWDLPSEALIRRELNEIEQSISQKLIEFSPET